MEKELLAMVFAIEKFRSYLVGAKVIVYIDHVALKYVLTKKDAKPCLIRWILLLQDYMRDDTLLKVSTTDPWYANIINYIVVGYIPPGADRNKIIRDSILHLWDDPYLYRVCVDGLLRRCIPAFKTWKILERCHSSPYGGHYRAFRTNAKV
jgi:hypothetical protein